MLTQFDPFVVIITLVGLALLPFVAAMVTSYLKIVVVLSLLRNALGIQSIPPNVVINGLAIILSAYVMAPVFQESYSLGATVYDSDKKPMEQKAAFEAAAEPFRTFFTKHSRQTEIAFFRKTAETMWPQSMTQGLDDKNLMVLIPAFVVSELTSAFQIGFLIYLPFIAIDIIVSNILLAMGMMMVSPMTISLPFKLLLFVLVDGWTRLIQGLVLTYS